MREHEPVKTEELCLAAVQKDDIALKDVPEDLKTADTEYEQILKAVCEHFLKMEKEGRLYWPKLKNVPEREGE